MEAQKKVQGQPQEQHTPSIVFSSAWVGLTAPIGEGAFSRVFEGVYRNPETLEESVVAVKILKKAMLKRRSDCLRFIKEAKIMTKISHRHIAACYGIGKYEDDDLHNPGSLFIVQELIRGGNLLHKVYKQMLNCNKCVYSSREALSWLMGVASGMLYLHSATDSKPMIIHRDLKLENIMLSHESTGTHAKLVDFGLHKVIDDRIKKVVKRVISEAQLGGRLGRLRMLHPQTDQEDEEEDELEVALAEQRAMVLATSVKPGTCQAASSSPDSGRAFSPVRSRKPMLRQTSRLTVEERVPSMTCLPELDEEDITLKEAESQTAAHTAISQQPPWVEQAAPSSPSGQASTCPRTGEVHSPPKKHNSMQRLMTRMREIKLKVIGKERSGSSLSRETNPSPGQDNADPSKASEQTPPPAAVESAAAAERRAKNLLLLDKLLVQQAAVKGSPARTVPDELGTAAVAARKRLPPRRAVTMINEIRYNLTEAVGSWAYMAPEVVLGQPYNEKVDVFSFGVIIFEVFNRKLMLVDEIKTDPRKDAQAYAERVSRGFRPEIPRRWPEGLHELISACWAQDPHVRPNFAAVVDVLKEIEAEGIVATLDAAYLGAGSAFI